MQLDGTQARPSGLPYAHDEHLPVPGSPRAHSAGIRSAAAAAAVQAFALDGAEQEGVSRTDLPASHYVQGLANEQHMCFANAVLQLLASSAQLNSKEAVAELESQHAVGPALSRALAAVNAFKADEQPADARPLLQHIARKRPDMDGQTQQDSHEALMLLLGLLDDEATAARRDAGQSADEAGMHRPACRLPACLPG